MFLMVMGAPGSCKGEIRKRIVAKNDFKDITPDLAACQNSQDIFSILFTAHQIIDSLIEKGIDFVMSRTIWESVECYGGGNFMEEFQTLLNTLTEPDGVIYAKNDYLNSMHRLSLLKKKTISHSQFEFLTDKYDEFAAKIGVPICEVPASLNDADFDADITFGFESLRRQVGNEVSIWGKQTFYREDHV